MCVTKKSMQLKFKFSEIRCSQTILEPQNFSLILTNIFILFSFIFILAYRNIHMKSMMHKAGYREKTLKFNLIVELIHTSAVYTHTIYTYIYIWRMTVFVIHIKL